VTACALSVAPLALALGWGALVLRGAARELPGQAPVEIAIVQGDVDLGSVWRSDFYGRNLDVYLQQTLDVAARGAPAVVFWPEAALTFFLDEEPLYRDAITRVLANEDLELVVGGPAKANAAGDRFWNSAFLLDATGATRARYDKQHLVPFSEFFPLARLDFLRRRFERVRVFEHGGDPAVLLPSRAGAIGVLTCNEAMLPEVAARRVAAGAQLLASPSNDSWIRSEKWAAIMFDMVALRAVETRRWLVRASTSGPSAIVDPWGRAVVRTAPFTRDVVLGRVAARDDRTVYVWIGDSFGVACGLVALAAAVAGARRPSV
jgi:apolipoprotein N-acyltransferase